VRSRSARPDSASLEIGEAFKAVYYRARDGSEPVSDFIDKLTVKRQVLLDNRIDRLHMLGSDFPHLLFPHGSQVLGDLRELRCHVEKEHYRVLYRRSRNLIVLLHIFRKDTGRIPPTEVRVAKTAGKTSSPGWMRPGGHPTSREPRRSVKGP
jgi:phage-related protein